MCVRQFLNSKAEISFRMHPTVDPIPNDLRGPSFYIDRRDSCNRWIKHTELPVGCK